MTAPGTAGPWTAQTALAESEEAFHACITSPDGGAIFKVDRKVGLAKMRENAFLAAAAPDLFESLDTLSNYICEAWPALENAFELRVARAALAKALGK